MNHKLTGILMLCLMLISAVALASPKDDFKQIWEKQTVEEGRYQAYLDVKFALFGTMRAHSIIDVKKQPLFVRSEDSMSFLGRESTVTSYFVQNGETLDIYSEEENTAGDKTQKQWVHYTYSIPNLSEGEILLPTFDDVVRSVKELETNTKKGTLYEITLDGRAAYSELKKYYKNRLEASEETDPSALDTTEGFDREKMRQVISEMLKTWKNTENVVLLTRVKNGKITGVQTELAPQFNSMTHVIMAGVDAYREQSEIKLGGMMEAFLQVESMRFAILADGEAQFDKIPDEVLQTSIEGGTLTEELTESADKNGAKMTEADK